MATVKKTVRKKRRERKNIEKGQAHIQSTFNNTLVTLTFPGPARVPWDLKDPGSLLLSRHRWRRKKRPEVPWNMVYVMWKSM